MSEEERVDAAMALVLSCTHGRWLGPAQFGMCVNCVAAHLARRRDEGAGDWADDVARNCPHTTRAGFMCVACANAALTARRASTGAHVYQGACPDDRQPDARDPECPACRAATPTPDEKAGDLHTLIEAAQVAGHRLARADPAVFAQVWPSVATILNALDRATKAARRASTPAPDDVVPDPDPGRSIAAAGGWIASRPTPAPAPDEWNAAIEAAVKAALALFAECRDFAEYGMRLPAALYALQRPAQTERGNAVRGVLACDGIGGKPGKPHHWRFDELAGEPTDWCDHCGKTARNLVDAAIRALTPPDAGRQEGA